MSALSSFSLAKLFWITRNKKSHQKRRNETQETLSSMLRKWKVTIQLFIPKTLMTLIYFKNAIYFFGSLKWSIKKITLLGRDARRQCRGPIDNIFLFYERNAFRNELEICKTTGWNGYEFGNNAWQSTMLLRNTFIKACWDC